MAKVKKVARTISLEFERFLKTGKEQVTGSGEYAPRDDAQEKILPATEKEKIKKQETSHLAEINRQIEAIRKNKEPKPQAEEQRKQAKKYEEKKKQHDKWAVLKDLIRGQSGSKERNIRTSG